MNSLDFLTIAIQIMIFIGILGLISYQLRQPGAKWVWIITGMLVLLPVALLLPWSMTINLAVWLGTTVLLGLVLKQSFVLPNWLWNRGFSLLYFSSINVLIALWSLFTHQPVIYLWLVLLGLISGGIGFSQALTFRR